MCKESKKIVRLENNNYTWTLKNKKKEIVAEMTCEGCLRKCLEKYGKIIKHLHVKNSTTKIITNLHMINKYCGNLVCIKIDLSRSPLMFTISVFEENLSKLFQNNRKVETLTFKSVGSTETEYLKYLSTNVRKLYILERMYGMNAKNFNLAFEKFSNLCEFTYITPIMESAIIKKITSSKTITKLTLRATKYEGSTQLIK